MSERPAPATGQRWKDAENTWVIAKRDKGNDGWRVHHESDPNRMSFALDSWLASTATFVGVGPAAQPPVRAGQRWRSSHGSEDTVHSVYAGDECGIKAHDKPHVHWNVTGTSWDGIYDGVPCFGGSTLISDPGEGTTPATNAVVNPALQPKDRPGVEWGKGVPVTREVSPNGRDWTSYDGMVDADPFPAYRHRRENGIVIAAMAETPSVRIVGTYNGNDLEQDMRNRQDTDFTERWDAMGDVSALPASKPLPVPESHSTPWGGIWSLRSRLDGKGKRR